MTGTIPESASRVQSALELFGLNLVVIELAQTTRTAAEAAMAIGCEVGQIAKSLVFVTKETRNPILVIASGANRVNESLVQHLVGEAIEKADARFVREKTGFVIGGVPPVGFSTRLLTLIDRDLFFYAEIWAAAGTPFAVFRLTPDDLVTITDGIIADIKE
jgi:prolyl-tRNA editing enzyme YbaK/EbsC (Cys-tRNA(Pro) deacylase)